MAPSLSPDEPRLSAIARDYRERGYEVVISPSRDRLPGFLAGHNPSLIAEREGEHAVVLVAARHSGDAAREAQALARAVQGVPGWTFELALVGEDPEAHAALLSPGEIRDTVREAHELAVSGSLRAAFLLGWTAFEAALRSVLRAEGVPLRTAGGIQAIRQAAEEGILNRDEFHLASSMRQVRNALAHGFREEVDREGFQELLALTSRLLYSEAEAASP